MRDPLGGRFERRVVRLGGIDSEEYRRHARCNVLPRRQSPTAANVRESAEYLLPRLRRYELVVCFGRVAGDALGLGAFFGWHVLGEGAGPPRPVPPPTRRMIDELAEVHAAVVPHPSGTNRWWNSPENRILAAAWLTSLFALASGRRARPVFPYPDGARS